MNETLDYLEGRVLVASVRDDIKQAHAEYMAGLRCAQTISDQERAYVSANIGSRYPRFTAQKIAATRRAVFSALLRADAAARSIKAHESRLRRIVHFYMEMA
jgi:hypothetical protein